MRNASSVFAALGDETRLKMIARLSASGPQSIAHLTRGTKMTRQAVTKHLQALARAGVVRSARDGRERVWRIEPAKLGEAQRYLDAISHQWDAAIDRLRAHVTRGET